MGNLLKREALRPRKIIVPKGVVGLVTMFAVEPWKLRFNF